ncbi:ferredoxin [Streptomyces sp. NPDC054933]
MELSIDRERCCGAGMCALTAPEVFEQDAERAVQAIEHAGTESARRCLARHPDAQVSRWSASPRWPVWEGGEKPLVRPR